MSASAYLHFRVTTQQGAKPHQIDDPFVPDFYFDRIAAALSRRQVEAVSSNLDQEYQKEVKKQRWVVTKANDTLGDLDYPQLPTEVTTSLLSIHGDWQARIDRFAEAWGEIMQLPIPHPHGLDGTYIYVVPSANEGFNLEQLRKIAFGILYYEPMIEQLMRSHLNYNRYWELNSQASQRLAQLAAIGEKDMCLYRYYDEIYRTASPEMLMQLMEWSPNRNTARSFLWNFDQVLPGQSATINFTGVKGFRNSATTRQWVSLVVMFIGLCVYNPPMPCRLSALPTIEVFWHQLRQFMAVHGFNNVDLPQRWDDMPSPWP